MSNVIHAETLTSFDVAPDGDTVRLNVLDRQGTEGALELPAQVVNQLLMSLPQVIERALRNKHGNEALQLVHALECFRVDLGEPDENGSPRYVLTLRTHGGYEVPFAMTGNQLGLIVQTVVDEVLSDGAVLEPVSLNG